MAVPNKMHVHAHNKHRVVTLKEKLHQLTASNYRVISHKN